MAPDVAPDVDPLSWDLEAVNEYVRRQGLLADVHFDYDRAELRHDARARLDQNARFLQARPEFVVRIEGHCDERGTAEYNITLGGRRASTSLDDLTVLGVKADRLQTVSFGKEHPVCTDGGESCWQQNRRAHFVIVGRRSVTPAGGR